MTRNGKPVLSVALPTQGGVPFQVTIEAPVIETPWRIHTGDTLRTLRAHHRGIDCIYGAAEGDEGLWCRRMLDGDGWCDGFQYTLGLGPLGKDRSMFETDRIDLARLAHLKITSITWHPPTAQ